MPCQYHPSLPLNSRLFARLANSHLDLLTADDNSSPAFHLSYQSKMGSRFKRVQIQEKRKAQSDLIARHKLETEFYPDYVRHRNYPREAKNKHEKVEEEWSNCCELGRGGFGVVHMQVEKTTGHYRAIKTIQKRLPLKLDYSRELIVMAILAKVCCLARKKFTPVYHSPLIFLLSNRYSSAHRYSWSS